MVNADRSNQRDNPGEGKSKRGFASMSAEKRREIAAKGGKASHGGGRPANR